jgi:two-component system LytT family response regulator
MIKAVIIEDEQQSQEILAGLIDLYCPDVSLAGIASNIAQARSIIASTKPQLVFLDVDLGGDNGFDLFKYFSSPSFEVVFTTAHKEHALDAIRFSCLDYLLKPIDFRELQRAVKRVHRPPHYMQNQIENLVHNLQAKGAQQYKLAVSHLDGYDFISVDNIIVAKAEGNYTRIYTHSKEILTSRTLGEFESLLPQSQFFRTHKSYLINLAHLEYFNKNEDVIFLHGNHRAELASRKREAFLKLAKANSLKLSS